MKLTQKIQPDHRDFHITHSLPAFGAKREEKLGGFCRGMTIVELMIVCVIIGIIISISVPALVRNKMTANEKATQRNLRAVGTAAEIYKTEQGVYPLDLLTLGSENPPMIDPVLSRGTQSGYQFEYARNSNGSSFVTIANPSGHGVTGIYSYCLDRDARIKEYDNPLQAGDGEVCP